MTSLGIAPHSYISAFKTANSKTFILLSEIINPGHNPT